MKQAQPLPLQQQDQQVHYQSGAGEDRKPTNPLNPKTNSKKAVTCYRCGGPHLAPACRHIDTVCNYCKKKGHLVRMCKSKAAQGTNPAGAMGHTPKKLKSTTNFVQDTVDNTESDDDDTSYGLFALKDSKSGPMMVDLTLNSIPVRMELDTGASATIISDATYQHIQSQNGTFPLQPAQVNLKTYTGETLSLLGSIPLQVRYGNQQVDLVGHVVSGEGPNLLGRDWLQKLTIDFGSIHAHTTEQSAQLEQILDKYSVAFKEELGCMEDFEAHLDVDDQVPPKFLKPRKMAYTGRDKIDKEIQKFIDQGILSPVKTTKWATPLVATQKRNGKIRLCGDFKVTLNKALRPDPYPLPRAEDLFAALAGGKLFTKLDLAQAYLQLRLDEQSKNYAVVNTHKGLFQFNRLPFGASTAPAIFQRCMDTLMQGIPNLVCYMDDILVTGPTVEQHLQNVEEAMRRLVEAGLRLNREKCFFLKSRIEYLGCIIDENGRHPTDEKIRAIREAPRPQNVSELRAFLGIINYYGKFMPNLSSNLAPLYGLLKKNSKWVWGEPQESAFKQAKEALQDDALLVHYDPDKPLILACDASQYGIGAVLSHVMEDGQERPIAYASRTLNPAEKRYSQLDKEALAIVAGVKKFHEYLYGRNFTIKSDHQPLSYLFSENKGIPQLASARIQRWALALSAYNYTI